MTDQRTDDQHDEELLLEDEAEADNQDDSQAEQQEQGQSPEPDVIGFEDEQDTAPATESELIKHLRKEIRERDKQLSQSRRDPTPDPLIVVGEKPTMEACDWDAEKFEQEFDAWDKRRQDASDQQKRRDESNRQQQQKWQAVTERYNTSKAAFASSDKDEREETVFAALPEVGRAVLAKVAQDPFRLVHALASSPTKLAELAKIDDPLELAAAVARMESKVATRTTNRPPEPDTAVRGRAPAASRINKEYERLEKEAERTGDRTALREYRQKQRAK